MSVKRPKDRHGAAELQEVPILWPGAEVRSVPEDAREVVMKRSLAQFVVRTPRSPPAARRVAPRLEALEERCVPVVFNVPAGNIAALYAALNTANANGVEDTVNLAPGATYTLTTPGNAPDPEPTGLTLLADGGKLERRPSRGIRRNHFAARGLCSRDLVGRRGRGAARVRRCDLERRDRSGIARLRRPAGHRANC